MGADSKIQWTHATFNPWWGCARVSAGCERCYAETFSKRVGLKVWGSKADRRFFGDKHWAEPLKWDRAAAKAGQRHRVFCASMADVFEDRADLEPHRARLFRLIESTPNLDWLLLTKRPENMTRLATDVGWIRRWPENVWAGTTTEDQPSYDKRWPILYTVPARVHFISYEPAIGPLTLKCAVCGDPHFGHSDSIGCDERQPAGHFPDWVIVGGESGGGARPFDVRWAEDVVEQCRRVGAKPFVKQLGKRPYEEHGRSPHPIELADGHGGEWDEWPERYAGLRVREFPRGAS